MRAIRTFPAGQKSLYLLAERIRDWKPVSVHITGVMGVMPVQRRVQMPGTAKGGRASEPTPALKEMIPGNQPKP